uniref:RNB domain-containing protein n=1 Tax=viral metagenome TaxID=1070528 RepID=A0A6C0E716_9ZZZZ
MTNYKIIIDHRNYDTWKIVNATTFDPCSLDIGNDPGLHKLLNNDIFTFNKEKVNIVHSVLRSSDSIAGVLILENNKTYGRMKDKLLYKCVPDDIRIPSFLVPYEMKKMGFSKSFVNLYVTFRFHEWTAKHPQGILQQVIGPVDVLENFYEYQLYCKSLNTSIQKFHKDTIQFLKKKSEDNDHLVDMIAKEYPHLECRTNLNEWNIFSVDPDKSVDFDDAFSIKPIATSSTPSLVLLSIYISNVTVWIDYLNLWKSFSRRISTIYLPDKKRPMLPTILSDCLCSLQQNKKRIAFVLDITLDTEKNEILDLKFVNCVIQVKRNYVYEHPELLVMNDYIYLLKLVKRLSLKYNYLNNIQDSHDVVGYLMIFMNYHAAQDLLKHKNGIFRSTTMKKIVTVPDNIPAEVGKFITIWNSFSGQYINMSETQDIQSTRHDVLEMDAYIHITSPIRRLVDLLNMIQFQFNRNMITLSDHALTFYKQWLKEMDYINTTMRSIRKVQNDCQILDLCSRTPAILDKLYEGYCFDKIVREDGLYQMIVYLPEIKLTSRVVIRDNLENYEQRQFQLYLFHNEEKFKKKIRLQLV